MLILLFLQVITGFFRVILMIVPDVTTLPFGLDGALVTMMGYINGLTSGALWFFKAPILGVVTILFLIIPLMVLRLFIGSRAPEIGND